MKFKTSLFFAVIGLLSFMLILAGCSTNKPLNDDCSGMTCNVVASPNDINIEKLEIYHFHGTNQCYSCITMGDYAEATVNTYFKDELEKGIIVFDHINGELPENRDLVMKYEATGSSLWFGTYKGDDFKAEENVNVWYKIQDKQAYMNYLKGVIEQKLAGN
ncbi:MAG: nitrophenyl compound nitroreductase subunit ArsF family protein [Bacteroidales bacterium]